MTEKNKNIENLAVYIAKAEISAFLLTIAVMLICSAILTFTDTKEDCIGIVSAVCTFVSTFIAGFIISSGAEKRGIFWGMLGGFIYVVVLISLIFVLADNIVFTSGKILCIAISIFGGAFGGIFGINHKK